MKKLVLLTVLILALSSGMAMAAATGAPMVLVNFTMPSVSNAAHADLDMGSVDNWIVTYSGSAAVTNLSGAPSDLIGNFVNNNIYQFESSSDGLVWTPFDQLVQGFTTGDGGEGGVSLPDYTQNIYAQYFRVGFDATVTGAPVIATGSGIIKVDAVPEPSSMIALATGMFGVLGFIRRRRS